MSVLTTQTNKNLQRADNNLLPISPTASAIPLPSVDSSMSLRDILTILKRRKYSILLMLLSLILLSLLYTFAVKPTYRANAVIQIEREGADIVKFGNNTPITDGSTGVNDPFFRTRYEMLRGRVIANRVINELNLYESLVPKKRSIFSLSGIMDLLGLKDSSKTNSNKSTDYASIFSKNLLVQPIDKTHLVQITYEAHTPDEARNVVTSVVNNFIRSQIEAKSETGEYAKTFLGEQLADAKERLRKSENALVKYANEKGILGVDDKQGRHIRKLENLDAALVQAEIKRIEAESLYQQMKKVGSVSTVLSNPVITNLKASLVKLEGDYQEMLKTFKPNYPDMRRLQQQINNARSKLNQEMGNIQNSMRADYLAAKRQENKIRTELSAFNEKMRTLQDSSLDYNTLKREVETNEKLYNTLLQRFEEVNVTSAANTSSISIVEPAITPFKRYRPKPLLNLLIGSLSGLILGIGLAFLRESLDQSVKSPDELERISGLPVLGLIPRVTKNSVKKVLGVVVKKKPRTPIAEAYRLLATNIRFMIDSKDENVILISSANPKEGKSTTATNIALSYAQMGLKVLLVDADIRKPSLHEKLGISNKLGLSNYLKGEVDLVGITQPVKDIQGLYAITAGKYDSDPISLLSHERMSYLTTQGSTIFDYVIIDAPPILGFADTLILSSLATSTIIVAKENKLNSNNVETVLKQLYRVKNNVLGFLLVDVKNSELTAKLYKKYSGKANKFLLDKKINFAS